VSGVALRGRIRDPKVDLEGAIGLRANVRGPGADRVWFHEQCTATAKSTGVGNGNSKGSGRGTGHWRHQDRYAKRKHVAERAGSNEGGQRVNHWLVSGIQEANAIGPGIAP
jgi:hypothetical protein